MNFRNQFDRVFTVETAIAGTVFLLVVAALAFGILRYRGSRRASASQNTEHPRVEGLFAVAVLAIAVSVYVFTFRANSGERVQAAPAVTVAVTGFQWCWSFHYVSTAVTVTGDCQAGHDPTLVVPTNEPIQFLLTSTDVIHSFWVPFWRYKLDAFPHHTNHFETVITRPGTWQGHCAQFCGLEHAKMLFTVKAVPPAAFQQWLGAQAATAAAP